MSNNSDDILHVVVNIGPWMNTTVMSRYEIALQRLFENRRFHVIKNVAPNAQERSPFSLIFKVRVPPITAVQDRHQAARHQAKEFVWALLYPQRRDADMRGIVPHMHPTFCRRTRLPHRKGFLGPRQLPTESERLQAIETDVMIRQREYIPTCPRAAAKKYVPPGYTPHAGEPYTYAWRIRGLQEHGRSVQRPQNYGLQNGEPQRLISQSHAPQNHARLQHAHPKLTAKMRAHQIHANQKSAPQTRTQQPYLLQTNEPQVPVPPGYGQNIPMPPGYMFPSPMAPVTKGYPSQGYASQGYPPQGHAPPQGRASKRRPAPESYPPEAKRQRR
ncbi:uncharacterized protein KD926_011173 [Aspergillus affinis]|uniref:uncharacterized protein n=1 Tax=Aspergillus affinis TaxID=1070780 RepID=UPI0022FF0EA2|nr:uncharacterized protein KD926_011173 [Aspergillus affinis]KAI9038234.1 hypothetical protein KD926_011173 [Aspergillus affinis]